MADKKRVLVVDDDPSIREFVTTVLSLEYETMEAEDGVDGWKKTQDWKPHLVITDLMMPRMHGYELCARIKGPEAPAGIKVMIVSAKTFETDKAHAMAAGADSYIVKPFSVDELREKSALLLSAAPAPVPAEALDQKKGSAIHSSELPAPAPAHDAKLPVHVRFWGTRGSCPVAGARNAVYGGNTSCVEVRVGERLIIIDCGSGLRELGGALLREYAGKPIEGHVFVGHTHWDHIQGFPFFAPFYSPKNTFNVYSVHGANGSLRKIFSESMAKDYFPVPLANLGSKLSFVELEGPVDLGVAKVTFHHLNHPGPCIGFRIEAQGRVIVYVSDHEGFRRLSGEDASARRLDASVAEFCRGADLLIREAQYTAQEYSIRKGWGHSTFEDAVDSAADSAPKRMALFHHDPDHDDQFLDAQVEYCRAGIKARGLSTDCFGARDGQRIDL